MKYAVINYRYTGVITRGSGTKKRDALEASRFQHGGAGNRTLVRVRLQNRFYVRRPDFLPVGPSRHRAGLLGPHPPCSRLARRGSALDQSGFAIRRQRPGRALTPKVRQRAELSLRSQCQFSVGSWNIPDGLTRDLDLGTLRSFHQTRRSQSPPGMTGNIAGRRPQGTGRPSPLLNACRLPRPLTPRPCPPPRLGSAHCSLRHKARRRPGPADSRCCDSFPGRPRPRRTHSAANAARSSPRAWSPA